MAQLIKIATSCDKPCHNVVLVHGLGGHPYDTWRRRRNDGSFWPVWLAQDLSGIAVFSYGYDSPATNWIGTAMPLLDEASHALQVFLASDDLRTGSISFVCHSLGGLIVKQVLRIANEQSNNPEVGDLFQRIKQVVFIATPHTGSGKAGLLNRLSFLAWPSHSARDLVANRPELRHLNFSYRELASRREDTLSHLVYYEMSDTLFGRIVDEGAADPGVPACVPTPIKSDHVVIAKPHSRDELLYKQTKKFIANALPANQTSATLVVYPEMAFKADRTNWEYIPKLARLGLLALVVFGLWTFVPHLVRAYRTLDEMPKLYDSLQESNRRLAQLIADKQAASLPSIEGSDEKQSAKMQAQKSIEPAVADLSQRNDDQSKRAFAALERGDTSQAESLFQNIADEEKRAGNKAAAAQALRNIAAFNRLTNVAKAADLYSKAAQLQPEDYSTWYDLGVMATLSEKYSLAEDAFKNAVALAKRHNQADPNDLYWRREMYASQAELGNTFRLQGKWTEATKMFAAAVDVAASLIQSAPENLQFKRDYSVALEKWGHVLNKNGDYRNALVAYQQSLDLAEKLAITDDAGSQRDLAVALREVAGVQSKLGNLDLAAQYYGRSVKILTEVAKNNPKDPEYQIALAALLGEYGDFLLNQGKVNDALLNFEGQISETKQLLAAHQREEFLRKDLSVTYYKVGEIYRCKGNRMEALVNYSASVSIVQGINASNDALMQGNLNLSRSRIRLVDSGQSASCAGYVTK